MSDGFLDAYDTRTGRIHRVPRDWIGDPVCGRFLKKTPSQRVLDGELTAPGEDATAGELRDFAAAADLDVTGRRTRSELAEVVTAALDDGAGLPTAPDPDAPTPLLDDPTDPDTPPVTDETPATTGGKEN